MSKLQTYTYRLQVRGHFAHQDACSEAHVGDLIWVIPEPENKLDSNPILFHNRTGDLLGYAPAEVNEELLSLMTERCFPVTIHVALRNTSNESGSSSDFNFSSSS